MKTFSEYYFFQLLLPFQYQNRQIKGQKKLFCCGLKEPMMLCLKLSRLLFGKVGHFQKIQNVLQNDVLQYI